MTLKLHGLPVSTYYNVAKLGLLEKGVSFAEVALSPAEKTEDFLRISPMGKIPVLETEDGFVSESQAILRYLELRFPTPALYPSDPMKAGRVQQIHMFIDLYVQPAAGALVPMLFFGAPHSDEMIADSKAKMAKGIEALGRVCRFDPFIGGEQVCHADLAAVTQFDLMSLVWGLIGEPDPLDALAGSRAYRERMYGRASVSQAFAARDAMLANLQSDRKD